MLPPEAVAAYESRGYRVIDCIGKGGFASIYKIFSDKYQMEFAMKVFPLKKATSEYDSYKAEVECIRNLLHPNVILFYDQFCESDYAFIVMEFCEHGSLVDYMEKHGCLPIKLFDRWMYQIIDATRYLHSRGLAHADLKPANILIDSNMRLKLADFGISRFYNNGEFTSSFKGSIGYMPPESFNGAPYDPFKADLWSLGITLYQLVEGKLPWHSKDKASLIKEIRAGIIDIPSGKTFYKRIILQLTKPDPSDRRMPSQDMLVHIAPKLSTKSSSKLMSFRVGSQNMAQHNFISSSFKISGARSTSVLPPLLKRRIVPENSTDQTFPVNNN